MVSVVFGQKKAGVAKNVFCGQPPFSQLTKWVSFPLWLWAVLFWKALQHRVEYEEQRELRSFILFGFLKFPLLPFHLLVLLLLNFYTQRKKKWWQRDSSFSIKTLGWFLVKLNVALSNLGGIKGAYKSQWLHIYISVCLFNISSSISKWRVSQVKLSQGIQSALRDGT